MGILKQLFCKHSNLKVYADYETYDGPYEVNVPILKCMCLDCYKVFPGEIVNFPKQKGETSQTCSCDSEKKDIIDPTSKCDVCGGSFRIHGDENCIAYSTLCMSCLEKFENLVKRQKPKTKKAKNEKKQTKS